MVLIWYRMMGKDDGRGIERMKVGNDGGNE